MDNVTFTEYEGKTFATIDNGNGAFTVMLKSEYDRRKAEQPTPIIGVPE
jgi:hypothetical protein